MADCLRDTKALASARAVADAAERMRRARDVQHTREVVQKEVPADVVRVMVTMAERIERLEQVVGSLAHEILKDG